MNYFQMVCRKYLPQWRSWDMHFEIYFSVDYLHWNIFNNSDGHHHLLCTHLYHSCQVWTHFSNVASSLNDIHRSTAASRQHSLSPNEDSRVNLKLLKMLVVTTITYILSFAVPLTVGLISHFHSKKHNYDNLLPGTFLINLFTYF